VTRKETCVQKIVRLTTKHFPSLSTPTGTDLNTTRVSVEQVVRFILAKRSTIERAQQKKADPGNDARDISMTSELLKTLSNKALEEIAHLKHREIRKRLKGRFETIKRTVGSGDPLYSFCSISKKNAEDLYHLPISWILEGAKCQLNLRKSNCLNLDRVKKMIEEVLVEKN